jgi:hypothetical protein
MNQGKQKDTGKYEEFRDALLGRALRSTHWQL